MNCLGLYKTILAPSVLTMQPLYPALHSAYIVLHALSDRNSSLYLAWQVDGRTDGRTDERTDGQTDGRTDRRTYGRTDGWTDRNFYYFSLVFWPAASRPEFLTERLLDGNFLASSLSTGISGRKTA